MRDTDDRDCASVCHAREWAQHTTHVVVVVRVSSIVQCRDQWIKEHCGSSGCLHELIEPLQITRQGKYCANVIGVAVDDEEVNLAQISIRCLQPGNDRAR